jgi:hypothetical protein
MKPMYVFFAAALALCLPPDTALAAKKRAAAHQPPAQAAWVPQPFPAGTDPLPPRYSGLNPARTWALLKSKADSVTKGEYETTQEYEARIASGGVDIAPLSTNVEYAFFLTSVKPAYDADTGAYTVLDYGFCQEAYNFGASAGWVTCKIAAVTREEDTYVGSNAYGAKAAIDRTTGKDFGIAVRRDSSFFESDIFDHTIESKYQTSFDLKSTANVPVEKARTLAGYDIGVLLVGKIVSPKMVEGKAVLIEPTISKPTDIFITLDTAPFLPTRFIFYVVQTGEILSDQPL